MRTATLSPSSGSRVPIGGPGPAALQLAITVTVRSSSKVSIAAKSALENGADLLCDRGEDLVRRRLSGNEHRQPPQRRMLLGKDRFIGGGRELHQTTPLVESPEGDAALQHLSATVRLDTGRA